jgi:hypothetical protein
MNQNTISIPIPIPIQIPISILSPMPILSQISTAIATSTSISTSTSIQSQSRGRITYYPNNDNGNQEDMEEGKFVRDKSVPLQHNRSPGPQIFSCFPRKQCLKQCVGKTFEFT